MDDAPITLSDIAYRIDGLKDIFLSEIGKLNARLDEQDKRIARLETKLGTRPCVELGENGDGECHADV